MKKAFTPVQEGSAAFTDLPPESYPILRLLSLRSNIPIKTVRNIDKSDNSRISVINFCKAILGSNLQMAKFQVSPQVSTNEQQSFYSETSMLITEVSSTETEKLTELHAMRFAEPEIEIKYPLMQEPAIQVPSVKETQVPKSSVAVSQFRKSGVRRCGRLSEY